jgi:hypothetical protein
MTIGGDFAKGGGPRATRAGRAARGNLSAPQSDGRPLETAGIIATMPDTEKVIVISMRDGNQSFALQRVERAESMGIPCIKGVGRYRKEYERLSGKVVFLPISEIQSITEYESEREYDESMDAADRVHRKSRRSRWMFWAAIGVLWIGMMVLGALRPAK